ncbi:MAG: peptidylprolyl isomerase [bacterium]|nr:peptidylprolyl isomerase [bacterium]
MKHFLITALILTIFTIAGCGSHGKVLVTVGGESITEGDLEKLASVNPHYKSQIKNTAGQKQILDKYIDQVLLYQESLRRGLHRSEKTRDKIALYKKVIIAQAALEDEIEKKTKEYYDAHRDEFEPIKLAHIYIKFQTEKDKKAHTEPAALALIQKVKARLDKGEAFEVVAKELSEDKRTQNGGGELGDLTLGDKRLERTGWSGLIEKALVLKKGELSDPIKSENGYHLIKVLEEKRLESLEEATPKITFRIQGETRNALMANLKKNAKIKFSLEEDAKKEAPETLKEGPKDEASANVPQEPAAPANEQAPPAQPPTEGK